MGRHWRAFILLILLATLALPATSAGAAEGDQRWARLIHARSGKVVSSSWHEAVAVAGTGDVYVAGTQQTDGVSHDGYDFLIARYTTSGAFKWSRVYDRGGDEIVTDVAADREGNVVVCGRVGSYGGFLVVKYSRSGKLLWSHKLPGGNGLEAAERIVIDRLGSVYVAGSHSALCLVKYNAEGRRQWLRTYAKAEHASELAVGPSGELYVGGHLHGETPEAQMCIVRYRPNGQRDWVRIFGSPGVDESMWDLDVSRAGVCATGQVESGSFVVRLGRNGTRKYGPITIPGPYNRACGIDDLGRVSVTGPLNGGFGVRRFDPYGKLLNLTVWQGTELGGGGSDGMAIAVSNAGYVYATGHVSFTEGARDIWTGGLSPTWQELFTVSRGSPTFGQDAADDIVLTSGAIYVAGHSDGDLILIKYERTLRRGG